MAAPALPALPLAPWADTKETLHRYAQIVGKVRLALMPYRNHWWNVPLYVTSCGLGTGPMPRGDGNFSIDFDFQQHCLLITCSNGEHLHFHLQDGLTVADFYSELMANLKTLGAEAEIAAVPYELSDHIPFAKDTQHHTYDSEAVGRFYEILTWTDRVFKRFSGEFMGKVSPVHFFWHSFDLAVTRFSGRRAPEMPGATGVAAEAYSHEVISHGFWAGDDEVKEAGYYAYAWPSPDALADSKIQPLDAIWRMANGSPQAFLPYAAVRTSADPEGVLLAFLRSTYAAAAALADWPTDLVAENDLTV